MALTPMPSLRRSIKADVSKNKSLKDILPSTADTLEVLSVEELDYHVYNTKTTVKVLENGVEKDRVLLYDRMNLNTFLPTDDVDPSNDVWRSALDFIRTEQGLLVNPSRDQGFEIKSCGSEEFEGM